jgi:hypothetical protein
MGPPVSGGDAMRKRGFIVGLITTIVAGLSTVGVGLASAAPVPTAPDAGMWQTDGRVDAVAYSTDGSTLYLAGIFHHLCPAGQAVCDGTGSQDVPVAYLAALNASTGAPIPSWLPQPDGEVDTLAMAPNGTLYAGGVFDNIGGQKHRKLAALNAATGAAVSTWKPVVNSSVKTLGFSPDGSTLYAGGAFTIVDGASRPLLAAMSAYSTSSPTEVLLAWSPAPAGTNTFDKGSLIPATINSIVVRPADGQVYAAGVFTSIGGATRNDVAALAPATGGGLGVAVPTFTLTPTLSYVALTATLTRDGSTLFVNGRGPGGFIWAADSSTGSRLWSRHADGDVQAAVATDTLLYVGGHFDYLSISGSSFRDERHHMAALDTLTGRTDPWNPKANSAFGVYGLAWSPGHVAIGGDFTQVQFVPHAGVAQFSGGDAVPPTAISDLSATSTAKGRVDLSWTASDDSDSPALTYRISRRPVGGSYSVLDTITGPNMSSATGPVTYSDSTGTIGSSYQYSVRAADPVFLSAPSNDAGPVTVAGDQFPPGTPTGVSAASPSPGNAVVTWTGTGDGDDSTVSYTVTRIKGVIGTDIGVISGPAGATLTYQDSVKAGGTFTYTVRAGDGTFTSPASVATAPVVIAPDSTVPAVPKSVTALSPKANVVTVTWAPSTDPDQGPGQISYQVSRKVSGTAGTGTVISTIPPGQTSFTDTTDGTLAPLPDKSYTYYVAATDGPNTSVKSSGVAVTVASSVLTDDLSSLAAWTLGNGATLDAVVGHTAAPSARLVGHVSPSSAGYAHRDLATGYRTVCMKEWVAVNSYDNTSVGQTSLLRVFSTTGNDIARVYLDRNGQLWIRSDWGSSPNLTPAVVPADGTWHSVQLCTTSTPDANDGSMTAWYDGTKFGPISGVDNSTDLLGSVDIGERGAANFALNVDDVSIGTTQR